MIGDESRCVLLGFLFLAATLVGVQTQENAEGVSRKPWVCRI